MLDMHDIKHESLMIRKGIQLILLKRRAFFVGGASVLCVEGDIVEKILHPILDAFKNRIPLIEIENKLSLQDTDLMWQLSKDMNGIGILVKSAVTTDEEPIDLKKYLHRLSIESANSEFDSTAPLSILEYKSKNDKIANNLGYKVLEEISKEDTNSLFRSKKFDGTASAKFAIGKSNYSIEINKRNFFEINFNNYFIKNTDNELPIGLLEKLLAHWIMLAWSGFKTATSITFHSENCTSKKIPPDTQFDFSSKVSIRQVLGNSIIFEICEYASGSIESNGKFRRIAPSAGNLGTVQVLCCLPDPTNPEKLIVFHCPPGADKPYKLSTISRNTLTSEPASRAEEIYLIFIAAMGRLKVQYEGYYERLAFVDTGISIDHACRISQHYDINLKRLQPKFSKNILKALHLPSDDPRLKITEILTGKYNKNTNLHDYNIFNDAAKEIIKRRSIRRFCTTIPNPNQLNKFDKKILQTINESKNRIANEDSLTLFRIQRLESKFMIYISHASNSISESIVIENSKIVNIVPQPGLSDAPVIYIVGFRNFSNTHVANRWIDTGEVLSALWIESAAIGLVGCMHGKAYLDDIISIFPEYQLQEAVLCLGFSLEK